MNTIVTAVAVNPSTPNLNKQQKQTAKELIAAKVQALIEQLGEGTFRSLYSLPDRNGQVSQLQLLATFWRLHGREQ